jgi:hypothetical protein
LEAWPRFAIAVIAVIADIARDREESPIRRGGQTLVDSKRLRKQFSESFFVKNLEAS